MENTAMYNLNLKFGAFSGIKQIYSQKKRHSAIQWEKITGKINLTFWKMTLTKAHKHTGKDSNVFLDLPNR